MSALSTARLVRPGLVLATGVLAVTLAACGGNSTPAAAPTTTPAQRPAAGPTTPPGAFGTAAAVSATSLEVQSRQSGQVTVKFTSATKFTNTIKASLADVKVGDCVTVTAASGGAQATKLTARTVGISAATSSGCTVAGGFGGGAGGGFRGGASGAPRPSRQPRPSGAQRPTGNFGRAFGSVSAVSQTGFTVKGVARGSTPAVTTAVTVDTSTTYTETAGSTSHVLAVGDCVAALGASDDTGAVTAKSISVSKPGSSGCTTFGGAGGGAGGGGFRGRGNGGGEGGAQPSVVPGGGNG
jgi:hypothetical protein